MDLVSRAKELRKHQSDAEKLLWQKLRSCQLKGYKFRRQVPIAPYIADFVCVSEKLIVEVDGGQHMDAKNYDERRSKYLQKKGYQVVRFWNNQVLLEVDAVLESIALTLALSRKREKELNIPSPSGRGLG